MALTAELDSRKDKRVYLWLAALFVLAAWWRAYNLMAWPVLFHPTLQYENAVNTRWVYLTLAGQPLSAPEEAWRAGWDGRIKGVPVTEILTALLYLTAGEEQPWLSGIVTSALWLASGVFLFALTRRVCGPYPALLGLGYYLFNPFGIVLSRSFQHEAAMLLGFLAAFWYLLSFDVVSTWQRAAGAGLVVGGAVVAKPGICLLPLAFVWLALSLQAWGFRGTLLSLSTYLYLLLAALPSVAYAALFLPGESHQLLPEQLLTWEFYQGWTALVGIVIGWIALLSALVGATLLALTRTPNALAGWALLLGYAAYAAAFSYASWTHDYYLAPLMPAVAFNVAALAAGFFRSTLWGRSPLWLRTVVLGLALAAMGLSYPRPSLERLTWSLPPEEKELNARIGEQVAPGTTVLTLTPYYGFPLAYDGWLHTHYWPDGVDLWYERLRGVEPVSAGERLNRMVAQYSPSHFVITRFDELKRQPELAALLRERYAISYRDEEVLIHDLRMPARLP